MLATVNLSLYVISILVSIVGDIFSLAKNTPYVCTSSTVKSRSALICSCVSRSHWGKGFSLASLSWAKRHAMFTVQVSCVSHDTVSDTSLGPTVLYNKPLEQT